MAVVVFDPQEFREIYPKFTADVVSDAQLQNAFEIACTLVKNTATAKIPYNPDNGEFKRKILLYLLVCHLCTLALWPVGVAGPMTSASQGSTSAGFGLPSVFDNFYFQQTPCGATFWQMMLPYLVGGKYYAGKTVHPWG